MKRRDLLQQTLTAAPLAALCAAGLLPVRLLADWPQAAFDAEHLDEVQRLLFGVQAAEDSDRIKIDAPEIAENGRVVPVEVSIDLPEPQTLVLLSDANPYPLLARARFTPDVEPELSMRVKLGESANLIALVQADGGLYRASRAVKVTSGGCGG